MREDHDKSEWLLDPASSSSPRMRFFLIPESFIRPVLKIAPLTSEHRPAKADKELESRPIHVHNLPEVSLLTANARCTKDTKVCFRLVQQASMVINSVVESSLGSSCHLLVERVQVVSKRKLFIETYRRRLSTTKKWCSISAVKLLRRGHSFQQP